MGRYIDDNPAARRKGAVFHQCALDLLPAGDRGLDRGHCALCRCRAWCPPAPPMLICWSLAAIAAIVALYKTVTAWFHRWTTETDVTNLRVVHKTGFIKRQTFEMSLDKVESVDVNQSIPAACSTMAMSTIFGRRRGRGRSSTPLPRRWRSAIPSPRDRSGASIHGHATNSRQFFRRASPVNRIPVDSRPRSRNSQSCRTSGGIPTARWRRCTRSIRCG